MAGRGGVRPGAGRPRTGVKHASPIAQAEARIADRLPELIDRAFELANGVVVKKLGANGKSKVYKVPPDIKSIVYLVDRVMGRAIERKEISGPDGGEIPVTLNRAVDLFYGDELVG